MSAYPCSAVVEIHRRGVVAAVEWTDGRGRRHRRIRTFTVTSTDIGQLGAWLALHDLACIAVVSLEAREQFPPALVQELLLALAQHGPNAGASPLASSDAHSVAPVLAFVAAS